MMNILKKTVLSLPIRCILESYIKIKINLNFYFHTSLKCLKRFYERLNLTLFVQYRDGKGQKRGKRGTLHLELDNSKILDSLPADNYITTKLEQGVKYVQS